MFLDPMYFILVLIPGLILSVGAQMMVKSAYKKYSQVPARSGLSGAQAAAQMLQASNIPDVGIEESQGMLSDHYDPRAKALRLSGDVYHGRTLAAVGIAAHEAGHALQDAQHYAPLVLRNLAVPLAGYGGNTALALVALGAAVPSLRFLLLAGVAGFGGVVLFQLINLPVEFNASRRAKR